MNRHVEEVTRAGGVFVLTPAPTGFRPIEEALAAEVARFADRTGLQQVAQVAHRRSKAIREGGHVDDLLSRAAWYMVRTCAR